MLQVWVGQLRFLGLYQKINMSCCDHHNVNQLIEVFNQCFKDKYQTELIQGGAEPIYLPFKGDCSHHCLVFTQDFFSSALHEISHWCIAGIERRKQVDFGYWYQPDGRSTQQQRCFEQVEVKPQALEWIFSETVGHVFHFSADNLNSELRVSEAFKKAVSDQFADYMHKGLPGRARLFVEALRKFYGPEYFGA